MAPRKPQAAKSATKLPPKSACTAPRRKRSPSIPRTTTATESSAQRAPTSQASRAAADPVAPEHEEWMARVCSRRGFAAWKASQG